MSKKRILIVVLCTALLITGTVMGTLAYLTSQASVTNTFTVGQVNITLDETAVNRDGSPIPGADRVDGNEYHLIPGKTYTKDPTLTVMKGSEESYVRLLVTVTKQAELDAIFAPAGADLLTIFGGYDADNWICVGETEVNNEKTYEFRYCAIVDASRAAEDVVLPALFTDFTIPGEITGDQLATVNGMNITVVGHAIQASGFSDAGEAWTAFDAQMNS